MVFRRLFVFVGLLITPAMLAAAPIAADFERSVADAKAAMMSDPIQARAQAVQAERLAEQSVPAGRDERIATAEWLQAEAAIRSNDSKAAGPLIEQALRRVGGKAGKTKLVGDLLMARAGVEADGTKVAAALADYQAAYNLFRDLKVTRSQSLALVAIGTLYQAGDDYETALKYYSRALDAYRGDEVLALTITINRATSLKELKRYKLAEAEFRSALATARQLKIAPWQAIIYRNIARIAIEQNDFALADRAIADGLAVVERSSEARSSLPQFDAVAAEAAFRRGRLDAARTLIERSFAGVDLTKTDLAAREAHYTAYSIYRALNDEPHAFVHLQAMKRLDDQVWKLTASTNTALMAARFDSANQETRIATLKADAAARQLAMAEAETRFQRILFGSISAAALALLGLLAFYLWQSRRARIRLTISNTALERALAAKTEFLATTSHEIRTPLNGILGMTQVMLADGRLDAASRDRVGIVHDAGLTMRALVDDILDVAKMETGNLTVEALPFDLKTMLTDVTRMWAEQARAKGLEFRLELDACPRGITGDTGRMRQMVYNLLSNAVKFTAEGSVIVRVAGANNRLTLAVIDTGIGIAPDKHDEIFESFKQADGGTTRQFGGTGLGLAIVRNIATAMEGSVLVDSRAGEGATFTIDLPLVLADIPEPEVAKTGGLLVVDKNPIARAMLRAVLEPRAGTVTFASSCTEATSLLNSDQGLRVLIDEATARAEDDPFAAIAAVASAAGGPVAVLWANLDDDTRIALENAGADQVIAKPIAGPALASAIYACNTEQTVITQAA